MGRNHTGDPMPQAVLIRHLPEAMRHARRWVNYTPKKVPLSPLTGKNASSTNPNTWATLPAALKQSNRIGYMLGAGVGCIDLDHCINPDGTLTEPAQQLVNHYPQNLIEISPSQTGLHIWGTAPELPGFRTTWNGQNIEFYSKSRYITITGNIFQVGDLAPL